MRPSMQITPHKSLPNHLVACLLSLLVVLPSGPTSAQDARQILAPTGVLRVGIYPGSPTSEVRDSAGNVHGLAVELGQELGRRLGVAVELVERSRIAEVVDGIASGSIDITVTNASLARAQRVSFTDPVVTLELGFLVPAGSSVVSGGDLDQPSCRIGVTQGGTSEKTLASHLSEATIIPVPSVTRAREMLAARELDAFATNKGILFQLSNDLPGSSVLDDRWGLEHLAIAVPKGREAAAPFLAAFIADIRASGFIEAVTKRAGLRGQAADER